jgi:leucyl/phenylalanyl-tRNA--protein transferase
LAARLSVGGFAFIDTQFITKHLSRFGAVEVPRSEYRGLLAAALKIDATYNTDYTDDDLEAILAQ